MKVILEIPGTAENLATLLGRPGNVTSPTDPAVMVPNPVPPAQYVREHVAQLVAQRIKIRRQAAARQAAAEAISAPAVTAT